jgi:hypothetical protein
LYDKIRPEDAEKRREEEKKKVRRGEKKKNPKEKKYSRQPGNFTTHLPYDQKRRMALPSRPFPFPARAVWPSPPTLKVEWSSLPLRSRVPPEPT